MNAGTITASNFKVEDVDGPVAGIITYDPISRTAHFLPDQPLKGNMLHTVQLTKNIKDSSGQRLNEGIETATVREEWQFTTTGPEVMLSDVSYSVIEGGVATITATLSGPSAAPIQVDYATQDITALDTLDYASISGTLNFAANEMVKTFMVTTLDDILAEGNEDLELVLSNPVSASLGIPFTATLTILDDDVPTIQFESDGLFS